MTCMASGVAKPLGIETWWAGLKSNTSISSPCDSGQVASSNESSFSIKWVS